MRADIDQVHHVELRGAEQMARADHVDLVGGAGLGIDPGRVRDVLGHVLGRAALARLGDPCPFQDPFDRSCRWNRHDPGAVQIPLDRQRPELGPRVRDQPSTRCKDLGLDIVRCPVRRRQRRPRLRSRPRISVVLFVTGHPLADPPCCSSQRFSYLSRAFTLQPATHRLDPHLFFGHNHLLVRSNTNDESTGTMSLRNPTSTNGTMS